MELRGFLWAPDGRWVNFDNELAHKLKGILEDLCIVLWF